MVVHAARDGTRHELVRTLVVQEDGERRTGHRAQEDDERAVEELLQVEDRVEFGVSSDRIESSRLVEATSSSAARMMRAPRPSRRTRFTTVGS